MKQKQKSPHRFTLAIALVLPCSLLLAGIIFAQSPTPTSNVIPFFGTTYSAKKTVPKKVFAEALAKAFELKLPTKPSKCYVDVKTNDKTTPSICALQSSKIFDTPKNKKILPESKISVGFAITTLCKAKNWANKTTSINCTEYAKQSKLKTSQKITYEQLAGLLAKSLSKADSSVVVAAPDLIPSRKIEELNFTPVVNRPVETDFFTNISLSSPLPNRFYKDEVFYVEGDISDITATEAFIFLCRDGESCDNSVNFIEKTNDGHFKIPVHFTEIGNFQLGIISGRSGQSKIKNISVIPSADVSASSGRAATSISVKYDSGKVVFTWNGQGDITDLVIAQGTKRQDYIFRQGTTNFAPDSKDFAAFNEGPASWRVEQNGSVSETKQIYLIKQELRKIEDDKIQIKSLPETLASPGQLKVSAKSLSPLSKKAAITMPNGQVKEFDFANSDLPANQDFTITADLDKPGAYIFEMNNPEGSAIVNVPIYVGNYIPLLPDFFALNEGTLDTSLLGDLAQARQKLLVLINADRAVYSLAKVSLADDLNSLAQGHSQNMADNNFFAHVNPEGLSPDDRRKKAKINTPIKENLGKATSLESVEAGLMRSPVHRVAILDPNMKRVGLGIVKDTEGYFIVTQNFAPQPLSQSDLTQALTDLLAKAEASRESQGLPQLEPNDTLNALAEEWSSRMAGEDFFATMDPVGKKLTDVIREHGVVSSIQIHLASVSDPKQLITELLKQSAFSSRTNLKIGLGLSINELGDLFLTAIYTP